MPFFWMKISVKLLLIVMVLGFFFFFLLLVWGFEFFGNLSLFGFFFWFWRFWLTWLLGFFLNCLFSIFEFFFCSDIFESLYFLYCILYSAVIMVFLCLSFFFAFIHHYSLISVLSVLRVSVRASVFILILLNVFFFFFFSFDSGLFLVSSFGFYIFVCLDFLHLWLTLLLFKSPNNP